MSDAATPPPNDLENQLEALMKKAHTEDAAPQAKAKHGKAKQARVTVKPEPTPDDADPSIDLAAQLDTLIAKAEAEADEAQAPTQQAIEDAPAAASAPDTRVIADGPDDVEDALDDLQGAFDAVQDVIADLESPPHPNRPRPASPPTRQNLWLPHR